MTNMVAQPNAMLGESTHNAVIDEFYRDGVAVVRGVFSAEECAQLRQKADTIFDDPQMRAQCHHANELVISSPLQYDRAFADVFMREPILSLVETVLGEEARFCGQAVIRNGPGQAISTWHVDDCNIVDFPLPDDVPRHDARIRLPVFWFTVQIALTDIETLEDGPTEVIRGSHYSGRLPNSQEAPEWDGRGPEPILCNAGDIYLFNHQVWHRGRPNQSQRTRYLLALQYARGGTRASRFQGLQSTPQIEAMLQDADERTLRVLGRTTPTYGLP